MEISLREWLIIGGILVIVLILFDGWRRINSNRNRLRIDIDRSFSDSDASEPVSHFNPELPNGGARPCRHASGADPEAEQKVADAPAAEGFKHTRLGAMVQPQALQQKIEPLGAHLGAKFKAASSSVLAMTQAQEKPVEHDRIEPGFASMSESTDESLDDQDLLPGLERHASSHASNVENFEGTRAELEEYGTDLPFDDSVQSEPAQNQFVRDETGNNDEDRVEPELLDADQYQETADEPRERWIYSTDEIPEPALDITIEPVTPLVNTDGTASDLNTEDDSDAFFSTELDYEHSIDATEAFLVEPIEQSPEQLFEQEETATEELAHEFMLASSYEQSLELPDELPEELSEDSPHEQSEVLSEELIEELSEELLSESISAEIQEDLPEKLSESHAEMPDADMLPADDIETTEEAWVHDVSAPVTHIQDTRALHEMDPLFDDIPPLPRSPSRNMAPQTLQQPSIRPSAQELSPPPEKPQKKQEVSAQGPVSVPEKGQNLDLDFDLDQPITMLLDRSRNKRAAMTGAQPVSARQNGMSDKAPEKGSDNIQESPEPKRNVRPERKKVQAPSAGAIRDLWADSEPSITLPDLDSEVDFAAPVSAPDPRQPVQEPSSFAQEAVTEPLFPEQEPVTEPTPVQESKAAKKALTDLPEPEHVLVITVVGDGKQPFSGALLRRVVEACGMEHGDMSIFHRFEGSDDSSPVQFSMANAVNPGTFDLEQMDEMDTPAVSFFMSMLEPREPMTAYECMLATAETLAKHVGGDLLDEDRSVMRPQTKEHYRQRIRDFEMENRRQQRVL